MSQGVIIWGLKLLNFILDKLPDVGFGKIPAIDNIATVSNIFAWANFFLPTTLIWGLLTITATYYLFKNIYIIFRDFVF